MVLLVFVGTVEIYSLLGEWLLLKVTNQYSGQSCGSNHETKLLGYSTAEGSG